ncbi:MAG: glycosyltransferase family 4 protein [Pseudochelatococcus sp.]|jgi:glycosyltransferase involved in cell wall biosynthesis|uniref:glycosyltransferase family 4 protein n=1 Tax=Pseudochelatococcus sp. TaxID=2020869 RepID=UPI003D8EB1B8
MKILLIHERFAPDSGGGGEYVALERARGLARAGHSVTVLCAGDPAIRAYGGVATARYRVPRPLVLLLLPIAVWRARQADIVHGFTFHAAPLAWLAARLAGRPAVCEQLGLFGPAWSEMRPGAGGRFYGRLEKLFLRIPFDRHLFLSTHSLALAERLGFRGRGVVVAPGIDARETPRAGKSGPPVVLFAGKFDWRKGMDRLCAVAQAMPEARFEAVGWWEEGAPRPRLPANLAVIEGRGDVYRRALARASVLLMPSRAETFGLVIYEAMQAGCSIVSTIPGDYAGRFLDPWDTDAAVAALRERLASPALVAREGEANRRSAARFTWERSTDEVLDLYGELVAGPAGAKAPS